MLLVLIMRLGIPIQYEVRQVRSVFPHCLHLHAPPAIERLLVSLSHLQCIRYLQLTSDPQSQRAQRGTGPGMAG